MKRQSTPGRHQPATHTPATAPPPTTTHTAIHHQPSAIAHRPHDHHHTNHTSMPKSKNSKKRKHPNDLSAVCNITGLSDFSTQTNDDDVLDCLQELASAQQQQEHADSSSSVADGRTDVHRSITAQSNECQTSASLSSSTKSPPPPGIIHRSIPNLKIELSRHVQIESLSTFLLQSCKGILRMPSFERWLFDSKLEEYNRIHALRKEWKDDPSLPNELRSKKRRYGRAALRGDGDLSKMKEERRIDNESRWLLASLDGGTIHNDVNICKDPILPMQPLETDDSSVRLLEEITSALILDPTTLENHDEEINVKKAKSIIQELCSRTSEAVIHLETMEMRLGRYQKFGWETTTTTSSSSAGNTTTKKKREKAAAAVDKITVEWNHDNSVCSVVYTQKKKRSDTSSNERDEATATKQHKPKPFVVKLNTQHYYKESNALHLHSTPIYLVIIRPFRRPTLTVISVRAVISSVVRMTPRSF
eukprot:scaffold7479_cov113-Cyclotella_meneghiniana.AAC.3